MPAIRDLIAASARELSVGYYTPEQVEVALQGTFGVDSQLIEDQTYWLIQAADRIVAAAGWSFRATLYGADGAASRVPDLLDPARDAARIRAFFVAPDMARRGLATQLLARCEREAVIVGFARTTLMATLPGVDFYRARGYVGDQFVTLPMTDAVSLSLLPMHKALTH
ncbi:MAG: GNAT family N-acetyltransferase [Burkholderiales bacterium]|nr:GNAT family N-acetyltransferase [Nitrosomonadaceae bacterium]